MKSSYQVLIDSDAFIGWFLEGDAHFKKADKTFKYLKKNNIRITTTTAVIDEVATVLSHRVGQDLAIQFLESVENTLPIIPISEDLREIAISLFKQQSKKGTSVTDCMNVAVCENFQIEKIFSFDKAYQKQYGMELLMVY